MKFGNYTKVYALASQGLFSVAICSVIGFVIGYFCIGKDSPWTIILAIIGMFIGLFSLLANLLIIAKRQEKELNTSNLKPLADEEDEE